MKIEYDKKDIKESPKVKAVTKKKPDFPTGWGYFVKRGSHCVITPEGRQVKFASKEEAMEFANG
jgi:hypothetical protein|tara:strand:- start:1653 stop:1844 length:192 start_codon:yes stop_codon:yes gene_type:complete